VESPPSDSPPVEKDDRKAEEAVVVANNDDLAFLDEDDVCPQAGGGALLGTFFDELRAAKQSDLKAEEERRIRKERLLSGATKVTTRTEGETNDVNDEYSSGLPSSDEEVGEERQQGSGGPRTRKRVKKS